MKILRRSQYPLAILATLLVVWGSLGIAQGPFTAPVQAAVDALTQGSYPFTNQRFVPNGYINWNTTLGTNGYGLRDNAGIIEFKNSGGGWTSIAGVAGGAPTDATYITQTQNAFLSNEQALGDLASGLLKSTTGTGVLARAVPGADYQTPTGTPAGFVIPGQTSQDILVASSGAAWARLPIGANGTCLGAVAGAIAYTTCGSGSGTPGGSPGQVQYNNAGSFGGITGATSNGTTMTLAAPIFTGATTGASLTLSSFLNAQSLFLNYTTVAAGPYAILSTDFTVECTTLAFTATLPSPVGVPKRMYIVKNSQTANTCTVGTAAGTIDGNATVPVLASSIWLQSDGSNWHVVASAGLEWPASVQGDIFYASAANVITPLNKDTNTTRYLANTGSSNNPKWDFVDVSNGVTARLLFTHLTQGSALSVLGVTGNALADVASIAAGSDHTVLAREGTAVTFRSVLESMLGLTDITTANVSTSAHGFTPKLDNNVNHFLNGQGGWTTPPGGGTGCNPGGSLGQLLYSDGAGACGAASDASYSSSVITFKAVAVTGITAVKTANYPIVSTDFTVRCDTSGGTFTVTLPAAAGVIGQVVNIKLVTGGNPLTVARTGSDTIDGATSQTINGSGSNMQLQAAASGIWIIL